MKFISVLNRPDAVCDLEVGMPTEVLNGLVTSVARQNYGIFSIADNLSDAPTPNEYRAAAIRLLQLADQIDSFKKIQE